MADDGRNDGTHEEAEREAADREDAFLRVIYALLTLSLGIVVIGVVGNLFDRSIHVEVAALGLILGAITTLLVGRVLLK